MIKVLDSFLEENFRGLCLSPKFFSDWEHTLRFILDTSENQKEREQAIELTSGLFQRIFNENDRIFFVTDVYTLNNDSYLLRTPLNIYLKYLYHRRILYRLRNFLSPYSVDQDKMLKAQRYIVPCRKTDIRSQPLIKSLLYKNDDISSPGLFDHDCTSGYDIYMINYSKKIIFHIDSHVCTILAAEKEQRHSISKTFRQWIHERNEGHIDSGYSKI